MKKTSIPKPAKAKLSDTLPEYQFDYSRAKPNRFTGNISEERLVVALDPEVSKVGSGSAK
jgi:hypothetical protein